MKRAWMYFGMVFVSAVLCFVAGMGSSWCQWFAPKWNTTFQSVYWGVVCALFIIGFAACMFTGFSVLATARKQDLTTRNSI